MEQLASEYDGKVVCKLNVDDNQRSAVNYGIMSIPPVIFDGQG